MPEVYMKQRGRLPEDEKLDAGAIKYLNENRLPEFVKLLGLDLKPGDPAPESAGVPRLFILDEEKPNEPRTLKEAQAEIGSDRFWELARLGKLFGYPAGAKEPVQVQLKDSVPGQLYLSEPLSADPKKLASRNYRYEREQPEPKALPNEVARPGFFARLMHGINSNWYKAEHEAYAKYQTEYNAVKAENQRLKEAYKAEAETAANEMNRLCRAVSEGAEKAFAAGRTEAVLQTETEARTAAMAERAKIKAEAELQDSAASAEKGANRVEDSIGMMMSMFAPEPVELPALLKANIYKKGSVTQKLKTVELPKGLQLGKKPMDRLFANLALHAQLDKDICREWTLGSLAHKYADPAERFRSEGLTEKEIDDLSINAASAMFIGDIMKGTPRVRFDQHFEKRVEPARQKAAEALQAYQAGNKAPLAGIITGAVKNLVNGVKFESAVGEGSMADAKLTKELLDLLDDDDDLRAEAENLGLTEQDETFCRGIDCLRELEDKSLEADKEILKAAANHTEVENKAKYLHDIFKYRTARAFIKDELKVENSKNLMTVNKRLETRFEATKKQSAENPLPPGMKPLEFDIYDKLSIFYGAKLKRMPATAGKLVESRELAEEAKKQGEEPAPDFLDELTDMTVKNLLLETKDTAYLAEKVARGKGLKDEALLAHESKLMDDRDRAAAKKAIEEKKELEAAEELDTAVIYDGPGV